MQAERSRKLSLVREIQVNRCVRMGRDGAVDSTRGYSSKLLADLQAIRAAEFAQHPPKAKGK